MPLAECFRFSDSLVALMRAQDGAVLEVNHTFETHLGYRADEVVGKLPAEIGLWADMQVRASIWAQVRAERRVSNLQVRMRRADGGEVDGDLSAELMEHEGTMAVFCIVQNVRPAGTQPLGDPGNESYRALYLAAAEGIYRSLPGAGFIDVNPAMARIFGYPSPEQMLRELGRSSGHLIIDAAHHESIHARLMVGERIKAERIQVRRADGQVIWISENARSVRDAKGSVLFFEGTVVDVTAQVLAEEALQQSQALYKVLVESSHDGVFLIQRGIVVFANQSMADILGMSLEALTGSEYITLVSAEDRVAQLRRRLERERGSMDAQRYEITLMRSDGRRILCEVVASAVHYRGDIASTGVIRDVTHHREAELRLRFHATHDPLTALPNRPVFQQRLGEMLEKARRTGRHDYAVLFLDLDGFKWLNDSLGHGAGDRLLVAIAGQLAQVLEGEAMLARYGGDEFTVLPTVPCDRERAVGLARRILAVFEQPFDIGSQQVFSGASVGIVLGRPEYTSPDQVLRDADIAMYATKDRGKSGFTIFDEAMHRLARSRFELETDFRRALERGEFEVHYQPIVELQTRRMVACEALVRWRHPTRGLLLPDEFLKVADETGMITELDGWVLREACARLAQWRGRFAGVAGLRMNVNVDERQLAGHEIVDEVGAVLALNGLPANALRLEVTETVFRAGRGHAQERLGALKALGVSLVVDDFGTGYSSLESFASSPFDALKVDRGFVRDMESNSRHRAIVRTIAGFAADLGLALTAEGVETAGQCQLLLDAGCRHGQGFLFSRALPAEAFEALLAEYVRAEV